MRTSTTVAGWRVRATSGPVPADLEGVEVAATVPGTVHTDLLDAGLIPDPYVDDGERRLAWMRRASWRYATTVRLEPPAADERVDLVLAGIDTVATIALGGRVVARTANMHRSYRVDVRGAASAAGGAPLATDRRPPLRPRARRGGAGADRLPPRCLPPAAEHGAQDGVQLRLGLGPGPADRRALAARDRRAVAGGADRSGAAAGVALGRPRDGHRRGAPRRGAVRAGLCASRARGAGAPR